MHIIAQRRLRQSAHEHPEHEGAARVWEKLVKQATWTSFDDVRKTFAQSADRVGNGVIFDLAHNRYRLSAYIDYRHQKVFIREIVTRAEYDREEFKNDGRYRGS